MASWFVFNKDSNVSPMVFHSQPQFEHKLGKKRSFKQNNFAFHETTFFL